ncbi:hypothetical protein [Pseudarthrobacter sp. SSS035]|nr:hypothetical protein [Pseudarthrobacter sp. SSS035]
MTTNSSRGVSKFKHLRACAAAGADMNGDKCVPIPSAGWLRYHDAMAGYVIEDAPDYQVLKMSREKIGPSHGTTHDEHFVLPPSLSIHIPVLSFVAEKTEGAQLRITVNGRQIYDRALSDGDDRCIQEAFLGHYLTEGENHIIFEAVTGIVHFKNVVLWYKRTQNVTFQWPPGWPWLRTTFRKTKP